MNETYYLRWKSQVSGPFPLDDIRAMLLDGRISKHHQISTDQIVWTPLQDSDDFRAICRPTPTPTQTAAYANAAPGTANGPEKLRLKQLDDDSGPERWYYAAEGQSAGPITLAELRELVEAGSISPDCPICREGEQRWVQVREAFPGFCGFEPRHQQYTPQTQATAIPNHLAFAIIVTLVCCLPFGIPAIVYAAQVNGKIRTGDIQGALAASDKAKMWAWLSFWFGLAVTIAYAVFYAQFS